MPTMKDLGIDRLSVEDRRSLAEEIWDSIAAASEPTELPLIRRDAAGALRIGRTRVLLELVVRAFLDGATPEKIVQRYSTLSLAEAYAVVAYFLEHRAQVEEYLGEREKLAETVGQQNKKLQGDLDELRQRLLAQRCADRTSASLFSCHRML